MNSNIEQIRTEALAQREKEKEQFADSFPGHQNNLKTSTIEEFFQQGQAGDAALLIEKMRESLRSITAPGAGYFSMESTGKTRSSMSSSLKRSYYMKSGLAKRRSRIG